MNVLSIGPNPALAMEQDKVIGDTQERQILHGRYLSNLFIVVNSKKEMNLKVKRLSANVIVYPTNSGNTLSFIWDAYRISKRIHQENHIDVVTTQEPYLTGMVGYILKKRLKIPLNVQLHAEMVDNKFWLRESRRHYVWNMLAKFILKRADSIRVVSHGIEVTVKKLGIRQERIFNFPVPADISRFMNHAPEESINIKLKYPQFENIILFVGVLAKRKNVQTLLMAAAEVVKKHPATLFLIVGDGAEKERLAALAKKLDIMENVRFEGKVNFKDIPGYYQACDFLVLPSWCEGWPRVVKESLASGKPAVVADACGYAEEVAAWGCGSTFPPDRPDILAQKIVYLLEHPEVRQQMGQAGWQYVKETQDRERDAQKYSELCRRTIELARKR